MVLTVPKQVQMVMVLMDLKSIGLHKPIPMSEVRVQVPGSLLQPAKLQPSKPISLPTMLMFPPEMQLSSIVMVTKVPTLKPHKVDSKVSVVPPLLTKLEPWQD